MTPQEQDMIGGLIDRVQKTQLTEKDPDAEQMLQQGLGRNPNALYILAQTVLVQNYALEQAQSQLADLKAQVEQMQQHPEPKHSTSFLGNLLGRRDEPAPPPPPPQNYAPAQAYPPPPAYPPYAPVGGGYAAVPPQYGPPPMMGGGGFLRGAAQTAAGVAAGALAFEGIESLMHGFGDAAVSGGREFGSVGGGERPVQEVVNNYYGDSKEDQGISSDERSIGDNMDRDFSGNSTNDPYAAEDSNDMYAAEDDVNYGSDDDSGSDFSDDSGSDDNSF